MTLVEIQNKIIGQFIDKDVVTLLELKDSIKFPKEYEDAENSLIVTALKNLQETGIINKVGNKDVWILRQPLKSTGQSVDISMETCNEIADLINSFLDANQKSTNGRADKLNITEAEIAFLIQIINELLSNDPS